MPIPRMLLRALVPSVPAAGCANAAGFRNRMPPLAGLIDMSAYGSFEHLIRPLRADLSVQGDVAPGRDRQPRSRGFPEAADQAPIRKHGAHC